MTSLLGLLYIRANGREDLVQSQFESIVKHPGQEFLEDIGRLLDAGVGIHFDQPQIEVVIDDIVVAENFEALLPFIRIQFPFCLFSL